MAQQRLISIMQRQQISTTHFNHFDYVDAIEQLSELQLINHPRKRKLVEEFAAKCLQKLEQEEKGKENKGKVQGFLQRMEMLEEERKQKMEAMRFLQEKYDSKNGQLKFYPRTNQRLATQKHRTWKDVDGYEKIPEQRSILSPNQSFAEPHYSHYSSIS